jgi:hypothetical protein
MQVVMMPAEMSHQPDNIFAGTQAVSLVEVRGTNHSLVHPRGAVSTVKRCELPWADCPSPIRWERVPKAGEGSSLRWRQEPHRDFECALAETQLPERPNYEKVHEFPIKTRRQQAK